MRAVTLRLRVAKLRPRATAVDVARESDAWGGAEQCSSSDSVGDARFALKQKRKESVLQNFLGGACPQPQPREHASRSHSWKSARSMAADSWSGYGVCHCANARSTSRLSGKGTSAGCRGGRVRQTRSTRRLQRCKVHPGAERKRRELEARTRQPRLPSDGALRGRRRLTTRRCLSSGVARAVPVPGRFTREIAAMVMAASCSDKKDGTAAGGGGGGSCAVSGNGSTRWSS